MDRSFIPLPPNRRFSLMVHGSWFMVAIKNYEPLKQVVVASP